MEVRCTSIEEARQHIPMTFCYLLTTVRVRCATTDNPHSPIGSH